MEIERKYLVPILPDNLEEYPCRVIEQGYLNTEPVIRIRRDNDKYEITYKSKGSMARQEYNLPLTREAYYHLLPKIDGHLIQKKRYMIPLSGGLTAELDIFEAGLRIWSFWKLNFLQKKMPIPLFLPPGSEKT